MEYSIDMEKVIKGLECHAEVNCVECPYRDGWRTCPFGETLLADALALLKEQEEREKRICKSICNFIRGACSTDTDDDKDFVCYEIQKRFTEGR